MTRSEKDDLKRVAAQAVNAMENALVYVQTLYDAMAERTDQMPVYLELIRGGQQMVQDHMLSFVDAAWKMDKETLERWR